MSFKSKIKCILIDFEVNTITLKEATNQLLILFNKKGREPYG